MEKAVAAWGHPRTRSSSFAAMNGPGNRWGATNSSQRLRGNCVERSGGESRVPKQSQREYMDKSGVPGIPLRSRRPSGSPQEASVGKAYIVNTFILGPDNDSVMSLK